MPAGRYSDKLSPEEIEKKKKETQERTTKYFREYSRKYYSEHKEELSKKSKAKREEKKLEEKKSLAKQGKILEKSNIIFGFLLDYCRDKDITGLLFTLEKEKMIKDTSEDKLTLLNNLQTKINDKDYSQMFLSTLKEIIGRDDCKKLITSLLKFVKETKTEINLIKKSSKGQMENC